MAEDPVQFDDPCDHILYRLLEMDPITGSSDPTTLIDWWQTHRLHTESFTQFLIRQNLLTPTAEALLKIAHKGHFQLESLAELFPNQLAGEFYRRLQTIQTQSTSIGALQKPNSVRQVRQRLPIPREGLTWGDFLLLNSIGSGGSSLVFRALRLVNKELLALKILKPRLLEKDPLWYDHFLTEGLIFREIRHPNLLQILDFGDVDGLPYLAIECIEGVSLQELLRHSGQIAWPKTVRIGRCILEALRELDRHGYVHRDVKPNNVLIARDGTVKLADFGLARPKGLVEKLPEVADKPRWVGTASHVAPENTRGTIHVDARADMYSFGVTLYQMITGHLPFDHDSPREVIRLHQEAVVVPPVQLSVDCPKALSDLIVRLLAKDPNDRFADYDALSHAWAELEDGID